MPPTALPSRTSGAEAPHSSITNFILGCRWFHSCESSVCFHLCKLRMQWLLFPSLLVTRCDAVELGSSRCRPHQVADQQGGSEQVSKRKEASQLRS